MKYRDIETIRQYIRDLREQKIPWANICVAADILTDDGRPNTKLAQDIGYKVVKVHGIEMPYEPHDPNVRERLGLRPVCPSCGRPPPRKVARAGKRRVNYKKLLLEIAMPVLDDIWHANNLTVKGSREHARLCYKLLMKEIGVKND